MARLSVVCLAVVVCFLAVEVSSAFRLGKKIKDVRDGLKDVVDNAVESWENIRCFAGICRKKEKDDGYRRTIIVIHKVTNPPQYLYVRGGGENGQPIPIRHRIHPTNGDSFYAVTSRNDTTLDWHGAEPNQGKYHGYVVPQGSPMMWTTNDQSNPQTVERDGVGYWPVNHHGPHNWVLDIDMDCSKTANGWFEFKGFLTKDGQYYNGNPWEPNFRRQACHGAGLEGADQPDIDPMANNHVGRCGKLNVADFGGSLCLVENIEHLEA